MRIQKIVCDRCGKEITGYPVEIFPQYVDRENGEESWPDQDDLLPDWAEKMQNTEFCERCTEKIVRFALGGLKENPEFEQAVQEMIKSDTPPAETGNDDTVSDDGSNEKGRARRVKIDTGKVTALKKAGWSAKAIAEEFGVSEGSIYNVFVRLKKEGKL